MKYSNDSAKLTKANKAIFKALRAINEASEAIGEMAAYYDKSDIFHASTVQKYNKLITAAEILGEYQSI